MGHRTVADGIERFKLLSNDPVHVRCEETPTKGRTELADVMLSLINKTMYERQQILGSC